VTPTRETRIYTKTNQTKTKTKARAVRGAGGCLRDRRVDVGAIAGRHTIGTDSFWHCLIKCGLL